MTTRRSVGPTSRTGASVRLGGGGQGLGRVRPVRLLVIYCVVLAALLAAGGLVVTIRAFDRMADDHASLSHLDRAYGDWSGRPLTIRDRKVIEDALVLVPENASYRVVIGSGWKPLRRTKWTSSLERDFLAYYMLPRRLTRLRSAAWVFCLGCDRTELGADVRVLSRGFDGLLLVKVLH